MDAFLDLLGLDIITAIVNFIKSIFDLFGSFFDMVSTYINFFFDVSPVLGALFILALILSVFFGVLKIIKLIPTA